MRGHKTGLHISRDDATRVVRNLIRDNEIGVRFSRVGSTIVRGNAFCHNETDIFHKLGTAPAANRSCKEPWTSE